MRAKYLQRRKMNQINSKQSFALNYTNTGSVSKQVAFVGQPGERRKDRAGRARIAPGVGGNSTKPSLSCCDSDIPIPKKASFQQSYGNYHRRALSGLGGKGSLASRVQDGNDSSDIGKRGTFQIMLTFKRPPKFTTNQYIANKRSKAIRCDISMNVYNEKTPACYNDCGQTRHATTTKDLRFSSSHQQIQKRIALRAGCDTDKAFESNMMNNGKCANID